MNLAKESLKDVETVQVNIDYISEQIKVAKKKTERYLNLVGNPTNTENGEKIPEINHLKDNSYEANRVVHLIRQKISDINKL